MTITQKLENMMHSAPFMQLTGARVTVQEGKAQITLPVKKDFHHAAGAKHGALYFLALDNAAFFAVNSLVEDVFVLTTSFTTYITRPVSEGIAKAFGKGGLQETVPSISVNRFYTMPTRTRSPGRMGFL